jgi:hypothetical protein
MPNRKPGPQIPHATWPWTLAILAFFGFQAVITLRSAVLEDDRWGWRMFHHAVVCDVEYEWVMKHGSVQPHDSDTDLVRRARKYIRAGKTTSWLGVGAVYSLAESYTRWAWEHRRPPGAIAFETTLHVRINGSTDESVSVLRWPH